MQARSWHDFVEVNNDGHIVGRTYYDWAADFGVSHGNHVSAPASEVESHANGPTIPGSLSNEDGGDMIELNLAAGTYTWSYRGTVENGIVDPWLRLYAADQTTLIAEDDDGGLGRTSQITFTTTGGTYYLNASSWYQVDPAAPDYQDNGDYTIVQWSPEVGHDAGASLGTAGTIDVGTNYNYFEVGGDSDIYAITLTAGQYYTFTFNGGVASEAVDPGESIAAMVLYNSAGAAVTGFLYNSGGETAISYYAEQGGTFYLRADPISNFFGGTPMTGGYTIDVREQNLADMNPVESLNWDSANNITPDAIIDDVPTVYIYFAPAGVNLTSETNAGWQQNEIDAVMHALSTVYTPLTGFNYVITDDINEATFKMMTVTTASYGARFYPQDPAYGSLQGIGSFNLASGGFRSFPQSLEPGGFSYAVILHEFGHAHGIAHPHDTGGGSEIMVGVTASTGSYGVYDLNQGVYTVMSYNDAWDFHPDGPSAFTVAGIDNGWSRTLGALDVAVMQARYGVQPTNEGNTVYQLTDIADDANYQTIVDTGGIDTISYSGALNAQIDLTAATLDYSPTGGGVISFLYNEQPYTVTNSFLVRGGYTIANGVVIENATGGSGDDALLGNDSNNVLTGNDGEDFLLGRGGNDTIRGGDGIDVATLGDGDDIFIAEATSTKSNLKTGSMSVDIITDFDAAGNDVIDLSELGLAMTFRGTAANKNMGDLTYKTYTSVNGAENALGFDIDGQAGASDVSGPVTVVYGNTDGGKPDFAIILLNTSSVDESDFDFGVAAFSSSQANENSWSQAEYNLVA